MPTEKNKQIIVFSVVFCALVFVFGGIFIKNILGFFGVELSKSIALILQAVLVFSGMTDLMLLPFLLKNMDKNN